MATNFEFYRDDLSNVLAQREGRCVVMEVDDIMKRGFHRFCKGSDCGECWRELFKYLAEEHIEQPKLTKRERAFCEAAQTGWIARDIGGGIRWFSCEPIKDERKKMWSTSGRSCFSSGILQMWVEFDFIHWKDEKPWAVEDLLKLEVQEDA